MGLESQFLQRVGGFQAEQAAAHDDATMCAACRRADCIEIIEGAVYKTLFVFVPGNRRHERIGAGGEHQPIVAFFLTAGGGHGFPVAVDRGDRIIQQQLEAPLAILLDFAERQVPG